MPAPANAKAIEREDFLARSEVFVDTSARMSIEAVQSAPFQPMLKQSLDGYSQAVYWFRLVVDPAPQGQELFLRIRPANRNVLTLYAPDAGQANGWQTQVTGNEIAWAERASFERELTFPIQPKVTTTYYLSMRTAATAWIELNALTAKQYEREETAANLLHLAVMLLIASIVTWALHQYALHRDRMLLVFLVAPANFFLLVMAIRGYLAPWIPDGVVHANLIFGLVLSIGFSMVLFHRAYLADLGVPKQSLMAMNLLLASTVVTIVLGLFGNLQLGLWLNNFNIALAFIFGFVGAIFARDNPEPRKAVVVAFYGVLSILLTVYALLMLGWLDLGGFSRNSLMVVGSLSAVMFLYLLHARGRAHMMNDQATALELGIAQRERELQQERLQAQEKFTTILAHELKNASTSIRLTLDAFAGQDEPQTEARHRRIGRAVHDIDVLVERFVLTDSLEQGRLPLHLARVNLSEALENVVASSMDEMRIQVREFPDTIDVLSDQQMLQVVLSNLVENALKYAPKQTPIEVRVAATGNHGVSIEISNAIGPAGAPDPARVFEKYWRGVHTNGHRGTGLGLYLVKWIVLRLRGTIELDVSDQRVCFQLWLPTAPPQV